jgi:eukaryotic-like serine/threonine-protein kinase
MDSSKKSPKAAHPSSQDITLDYTPENGDTSPGTGVPVPTTSWPTTRGQLLDLTDSPLKVGTTFGDFEVLSEVGRGGMGIVYQARQKTLDRLVAFKVLLSGPASNAKLRTRFLSESRAAAALTHPNIVIIYQIGTCLAGPYCAMEFIDGQTLETIIQGRVITIPSAVALVCRVAGAVQHAHSKGIIHRDLKPGNVMLDHSHRPVVMDFGLAKVMEESDGNLTREGDIVGTPTYMPPEQARGNNSVTGPTNDVYSLGAILYRLLAGKPPYDEPTAMDTLRKVLSSEMPPAIRTLRPEVPAKLEQVCMKCLEKDPAQRYPTITALAADLRPFAPAPNDPKRKPGPGPAKNAPK